MYIISYSLYLYRFLDTNKTLKQLHIDKVIRVFVKSFANIFVPAFFKLSPGSKLQNNRTQKVVVSVTSFPKRINRLWIVIETMLRQTIKPDIIILYLSKEQFNSMDDIPRSLRKLEKRGLQIRLCDDDLKSHKKYYYSMNEFPNDLIITIDDDVFYHKKTIESLLSLHEQYPDDIIANCVSSIEYDDNGNVLPYKYWKRQVNNKDTINVQIGIGGVLYPPKCLYKDVLNKDIAFKLSKSADDLWLFSMARLANKKIYKTHLYPIYLPVINKNDVSLSSTNVDDSLNDIQIQNIKGYYLRVLNKNPFENED